MTRNEVAHCAIDDRSAGRKMIELDLMTKEQHSALPEDEEVTAADRLIIDSPSTTRLIVLRALADAAGAGLARGIALHVAERASTGQATRTGSAGASPITCATVQALICSDPRGRFNRNANSHIQREQSHQYPKMTPFRM